VTFRTLNTWLQQFNGKDQKWLLELLSEVIFISKHETRELLVKRNEALLQKLSQDGIPLSKVIYVQFDDAGSRSAVMLNMLKDSARLERQPCVFIDSRDIRGLHEATKTLGREP
jgi:hypothetical protein